MRLLCVIARDGNRCCLCSYLRQQQTEQNYTIRRWVIASAGRMRWKAHKHHASFPFQGRVRLFEICAACIKLMSIFPQINWKENFSLCFLRVFSYAFVVEFYISFCAWQDTIWITVFSFYTFVVKISERKSSCECIWGLKDLQDKKRFHCAVE